MKSRTIPTLSIAANRKVQPLDLQPDQGPFFQGIGWLAGKISFEKVTETFTIPGDEGSEPKKKEVKRYKFQVELPDRSKFDLIGNPKCLCALRRQIEQGILSPSFVWLHCYPQFKILSRDEGSIYFHLVNFQVQRPPDVRAGFFVLRGLFQKIPQYRRPVFSIYRNYRPESASEIKGKIKAQHIPVWWKSQEPYRYSKHKNKNGNENGDNKGKDRENKDIGNPLPPTYCLSQIEVKLLPQYNTFGFQREIAPPTDLPKRAKAPKTFEKKEPGERAKRIGTKPVKKSNKEDTPTQSDATMSG